MQIFVRVPAGATVTLLVAASDTIYNVKGMLLNKEGAGAIPRDLQCLNFAGKEDMDNSKQLSYYKVKPLDTLVLVPSFTAQACECMYCVYLCCFSYDYL